MTPIDRTFMLNVDDKLSFETIAKIFKTGYSRIPIFEITKVRSCTLAASSIVMTLASHLILSLSPILG